MLHDDEDFITSTIRDVDAMLAQQRKEDLRDVSVRAGVDMAGEWDDAPDPLWRVAGDPASEWDTASLSEYDEWSKAVSEETDAYFDIICGQHGDERDPDTGLCPQCAQEIAEERRNDR